MILTMSGQDGSSLALPTNSGKKIQNIILPLCNAEYRVGIGRKSWKFCLFDLSCLEFGQFD